MRTDQLCRGDDLKTKIRFVYQINTRLVVIFIVKMYKFASINELDALCDILRIREWSKIGMIKEIDRQIASGELSCECADSILRIVRSINFDLEQKRLEKLALERERQEKLKNEIDRAFELKREKIELALQEKLRALQLRRGAT